MSNASVKQAVDDFRTRSQGQGSRPPSGRGAWRVPSGCVSSVARDRGGHGLDHWPSIGAISASLVAGNRFNDRLVKLEQFWKNGVGDGFRLSRSLFRRRKAAETKLQPIRHFGFDAAILLSDILVVSPRIAHSCRHGPSLPTYGRAHPCRISVFFKLNSQAVWAANLPLKFGGRRCAGSVTASSL